MATRVRLNQAEILGSIETETVPLKIIAQQDDSRQIALRFWIDVGRRRRRLIKSNVPDIAVANFFQEIGVFDRYADIKPWGH